MSNTGHLRFDERQHVVNLDAALAVSQPVRDGANHERLDVTEICNRVVS